ncbi:MULTISPECIES: FIST N-terminal domain-containing protein [Sulfurimonas]|uniref:FIST signal transduction protein n=1 Tax=Sulfurimonas TaxID=202746 RepID=UPI00126530F3|nr:FIST N-terminal domain-containing protein [Sulfurimonas indica]
MLLETYLYTDRWNTSLNATLDSSNTLIIVFASSKVEIIKTPLLELSQTFLNAVIIGASTAGEIYQDELYEDSLVASVMKFEHTKLRHSLCTLISTENSFEDGVNIAQDLYRDDLKGVFILSDGLNANGSKLTEGLSSVIPSHIPITGGLAADDDRFESTWVVVDSKPMSGFVCAIGFYGEHVHIAHASKGGWDRLGIERIVTKSRDSVLYELDKQPALEIYKKYLGEKAAGLPATGLLFPLELRDEADSDESKVRTILAVNEEEQSITFAGDIPQGSHVTLMKANYNRIIDGASEAAESLYLKDYKEEVVLSIAISCVGRRLVLKSRVEEELEAILDVVPQKTKQIGFYSYGEISPLASGKCDLHNQTMTLTLIWESDA